MPDAQWDVLVVGSGAAGLCAAIEAHDAGASVLVLEASAEPGGSSRMSGGMILAAGTELQRRHGIVDTADAFYHDYLLHTQWKVRPGCARRIADESAEAITWLERHGVEFYDFLSDAGYDGVPRTHSAVGRGAGIIDPLLDRVRERGIEIRCDARVTRLLDRDGHVVGVSTGDGEILASSVVLATGGFGADPERVRELIPATRRAGDELWYIGADGAQGDALTFARELDVPVVGHGRGVVMTTPGFTTEAFEGYLPGWMLLVNRAGLRFCDESLPYGLMDGLVREQGDEAWVVFDHAAKEAAAPGAPAEYRLQIPSLPGRPSPNWNREIIDAQVSAGRVARAETIEQLGADLGLPGATLAGTVHRYNEGAARAEDPDFGKRGEFMRPIGTAPFYGARMSLATVCLTSVGPAIDGDGRVIGRSGAPVGGLLAAGECTGGTLGDRYVGTGNSWTNCVVFGRIAGRTAAGA
ncbi:FAD-dependent oxidoreductase [Agromyces aerolatus]|uniref:FAD-dependent oxidoreductase n=1 Tax=Agromyces sp. LY-1074 TaxID=3074080 RepID=UPI00285BEA11|nr:MULTISPECIES: FAD-dependent oxidoreductase [unclassified Agromyces]MDR5699438.1 FAD-dependent oxidoreductase [Agromyces sp. LY-1074]MDR5705734.1 FAD-dependent oxidoreductase [Agromyces sp. LY-1358]